MYVCMYVCMHACMHVCMCVYVCMYVCMYVCIYIYIYTYIYIYIYIYGYKQQNQALCIRVNKNTNNSRCLAEASSWFGALRTPDLTDLGARRML